MSTLPFPADLCARFRPNQSCHLPPLLDWSPRNLNHFVLDFKEFGTWPLQQYNPPKVILNILMLDWSGWIDCVNVNSGDRNMQFITPNIPWPHHLCQIFVSYPVQIFGVILMRAKCRFLLQIIFERGPTYNLARMLLQSNNI